MKKISFILLLSVLSVASSAQSDLYQKVRKMIEANYPDVPTQNRLIAVNFWAPGDMPSRELNKAFNKNYNTYKFARLKGGLQGLIGVAVCLDESRNQATVLLNKDGAGELVQFTLSDLKLSEKPCNNVMFDSSGNKIYSDLQASEVFTKINQLLTR